MRMDQPKADFRSGKIRARGALIVSTILVGVFGANIGSGKLGSALFLTDVGEAMVLFAASIFFVIGVVCLEDAEKKSN